MRGPVENGNTLHHEPPMQLSLKAFLFIKYVHVIVQRIHVLLINSSIRELISKYASSAPLTQGSNYSALHKLFIL